MRYSGGASWDPFDISESLNCTESPPPSDPAPIFAVGGKWGRVNTRGNTGKGTDSLDSKRAWGLSACLSLSSALHAHAFRPSDSPARAIFLVPVRTNWRFVFWNQSPPATPNRHREPFLGTLSGVNPRFRSIDRISARADNHTPRRVQLEIGHPNPPARGRGLAWTPADIEKLISRKSFQHLVDERGREAAVRPQQRAQRACASGGDGESSDGAPSAPARDDPWGSPPPRRP